jgi:hypothetical protein
MKTLAKLTLTLLMITIIANTAFAEPCVVSSTPETSLNDKSFSAPLYPLTPQIHNLMPKGKMKTTISSRKQVAAQTKLRELILSMQQVEAEVNDGELDTQVIFQEIMQAHHFELTPEILSDFIIEEKEVKEDIDFLNLARTSSKLHLRTSCRTDGQDFH